MAVADIIRPVGISEQPFYRWKMWSLGRQLLRRTQATIGERRVRHRTDGWKTPADTHSAALLHGGADSRQFACALRECSCVRRKANPVVLGWFVLPMVVLHSHASFTIPDGLLDRDLTRRGDDDDE